MNQQPDFLNAPPEEGGIDREGTNVQMAPDRMSVLSRMHCEEEEYQYLKLLIENPDTITMSRFFPAMPWFSNAHRQRVFLAWKTLFEQQKPINGQAVYRVMRSQARPDEFEEIDKVMTIIQNTMVADEVSNLIHALRDAYKCRRFNEVMKLGTTQFHRNIPVDQIWNEVSLTLAMSEESDRFMPFQEQLGLTVQQILRPEPNLLGISTRLTEFDYLTGGLEPGNMIVLGGIQGSGKTAIILELAGRVLTYYQDTAVLIFSMEMRQRELQMRQLASLAFVSFRRQKDHAKAGQKPLTQDEAAAILAAERKLQEWGERIEIYDYPMYPEEFEQLARKFALKHRNKRLVLMLDHLGMVLGKTTDIRTNIIAGVKGVKQVQMEYGFTTIPLAQMLKELEAPKYAETLHKPAQSFIAEAGFINQVADTIMCAWRPEMYAPTMMLDSNPNFSTANIMFGVAGKNRNGDSNRDIMMGCQMEYMQIFNIDEMDKYRLGGEGYPVDVPSAPEDPAAMREVTF